MLELKSKVIENFNILNVEEKKVWVVALAPFFKSRAAIQRYLQISRKTLYNWFQNDIRLSEKLDSVINTDLDNASKMLTMIEELKVTPYIIARTTTKPSQEKTKIPPVGVNYELEDQTLGLSYDDFKKTGFKEVKELSAKQLRGKNRNKTSIRTKRVQMEIPIDVIKATQDSMRRENCGAKSREECIIAGKAICELYSQGIPLSDALNAVHIPFDVFYNWIQVYSNSYVKEVKEMYDAAKIMASERSKEDLIVIARNAIKNYIKPKKVVSTVKTGKIDKNGKVIPISMSEHEREIQPNVTLIRDVMKALLPEFQGKMTEVENEDWKDTLTDTELDAELERLTKENKDNMRNS